MKRERGIDMNFFDTVDFEATVRDFWFTCRAHNQILRVIESDDFVDMDSETIFRYLYETMELVSFKDYIKRVRGKMILPPRLDE